MASTTTTRRKTSAAAPTSALAGMADPAQTENIFYIDPASIIVEEGYNVRAPGIDLDNHIASLKASISDGGVREPLGVKIVDGQPVLRRGHCRLRAVLELREEGVEIPTIGVREILTEEGSDEDADLLISNSGKPLTMTERAVVAKRMYDRGVTPEKIARHAGVARSSVMNWLSLADAPDTIKELVNSGAVSETTAVQALAVDKEAAADTLKTAVDEAAAEGQTKATAARVQSVRERKAEEVVKTPVEIIEDAMNKLVQNLAKQGIMVSKDAYETAVYTLRRDYEPPVESI